MQSIKLLKPYGGYKKNDLVTVENNEAHRLIEAGEAVLVQWSGKSPEDRMIGSTGKEYRTKHVKSS